MNKLNNIKLLFSVTVFESYDSINDLVLSILLSHEDSYIVLHVSDMWTDFNPANIQLLGTNVFINPTRYHMIEKHQGQTGCNISNIEFFNTLNIKYDYVVLVQSNELYVSKIDIEYIDKHKYGSSHAQTPNHHYIRNINLPSFLEIGSKNGRWNGYAEGMFFSRDIADYLIGTYRSYYGNTFDIFVCDHEQLLHTMLYNYVEDNKVGPLCVMGVPLDNTYETILKLIDSPTENLVPVYNWNDTYNEVKCFSCKPINRNDRVLRNKIIETLIINNKAYLEEQANGQI